MISSDPEFLTAIALISIILHPKIRKYEDMRNVSEVAKVFEIDKELVKKWAFEFKQHLSDFANPAKGKARLFTQSDLRVLAVVYYYWDEDPDYEHIDSLLCSGRQDEEIYTEFQYLNTPIFQDLLNTENYYEGEEAWTRGIIIGDMASKFHQVEVARSYKAAADELVRQVKLSPLPYDLAYPIFFLYRHSIELYLKIVGDYDFNKDGSEHSIDTLVARIEVKYGEKFPFWIKERLIDFHRIDPGSTSFRYLNSQSDSKPIRHSDSIPDCYVDFFNLQLVMNRLHELFEALIAKKG
ncbi:MAG: hypothetical protein KME45_27275 [Stenomitos rutilans HA7619-LM2]|jgi:hypothetical protein|nr:hypothetical protein [Stenomitos rutilans HA7619-LM2]